MQNLIGAFIRIFIKLVLAAFALVFVISLLLLALIVVVLSVLKAVVTGKRPAPAAVFGRFQKFAPGNKWPSATRSEPKTDVVDVEVREITESASDKYPPRDPH